MDPDAEIELGQLSVAGAKGVLGKAWEVWQQRGGANRRQETWRKNPIACQLWLFQWRLQSSHL